MIKLFEQDIRENDRQSSKGNQLKWEKNGIWYKADYTGYEGLAEYMVSHLLQKSTLHPQEFVVYDLEQMNYKTNVYNGVKSASFLCEDWQIITLERLFQNFFGKSLYKTVFEIREKEKRISFLVEQVERITGLQDFGVYLNKLFTIDAFFLNEDRHTHNIAVLMNGYGKFAYCPIFDNGAALLADTKMDYPLENDVYELIGEVRSKTICESFNEQLDISEELYGTNLKFCFDEYDIKALLNMAMNYSEEEKKRVQKVLLEQMRKYRYLFAK